MPKEWSANIPNSMNASPNGGDSLAPAAIRPRVERPHRRRKPGAREPGPRPQDAAIDETSGAPPPGSHEDLTSLDHSLSEIVRFAPLSHGEIP